jgi:hypothetical protein
MMMTKTIDAVKMMREIRNKHQKLYNSDPELREKRLAEIRKKYAQKIGNSRLTKVPGD